MPVLLDRIDLTLSEAPLAFAEANRTAIDAHWARLTAANARLWNGSFYLFSAADCADGCLTATGHATDYATFLYWLDHGRDPSVIHITGTSLPITADGAVLAVRMASHTVNAGQVYFPAGSLDHDDVRGDRLDIASNIRRELAEETGLTLPLSAFDARFVAVHVDGVWFCAWRCRLDATFDACVERIARHQARSGEDEIAEVVAIRHPAEAMALQPHARALALWHLGADSRGDR